MGKSLVSRTTKFCQRPECDKSFEVTMGKAQQARRFCGRDCSNKATAEARGAAYRTSHGYVLPTCPCGKTIVAVSKAGYAYTKKYCDDDCRRKYAPTRQRDESKWDTYTCRNPACGKTFERRKNTRNAKFYCSQACADRFTKVKRHIVLKDSDVLLDSSWEAFFWGACMIAKIPIERFDREHGIEWSPGHWYGPDFWLPEYEVAVEIKGHEDEQDDARWSAYRQGGRRLMVFDRERLMRFSPGVLDQQIRKSCDLERFPEELRMVAPA